MSRKESTVTKTSAPRVESFRLDQRGDEIRLVFSGPWTIYSSLPGMGEIISSIKGVTNTPSRIIIDANDVSEWDSTLAVVIDRIEKHLAAQGHELILKDLPSGLKDFMNLVRSGLSPDLAHEKGGEPQAGLVQRTGKGTVEFFRATIDFITFTGELALGIGRTITGRGTLRAKDFLPIVQDAGADSLVIVSVVSFLVGVILGFVGTVQLKQFGAEIYVANLVGIAMARDMGAMMCGIIVAGRTGAAYAAHIGTMQVNEEIDALKTLGIKPVEYLVVPRVMALSLMVPMLAIYSDMMGLAGGALIGAGLTEVTLHQFIGQTIDAVPLTHFVIGVVKALVYGVLVAMIGCLRGLQCGRSAAAVGRVTTSSVVTAIVWIIVACAVITVVCYILGV